MSLCPTCQIECPDGHCRACGAGGITTPDAPAASYTPGELRGGEMLAGRYLVVAYVGAGGMGEVYRVHDTLLKEDVALKLLPARFADEAGRARLEAEVRAARKVSHPNVCRVHDIGKHEGRLFLTMEFVAGEDLRARLRQGRLAEEKAAAIAWQLCAAVAAVHVRGLLHRDLKPANVLLDEQDEVKLVDFGLAALAGRVSDVASGTVAYQAPEVRAGTEVTKASDLYALGLVLHEVVTGRHPFQGRGHESGLAPLSSHGRPVAPAVEGVILRCLSHDAEGRPRDALEVQAALGGMAGALDAAKKGGGTPTPDFVADAGGPGTLTPAVAGALLAVVLAGMVLFAWLTDLSGLHRRLPLQNPAHLNEVARKLARGLGHPAPLSEAHGLLVDHRTLSPAPAAAEWRGLEKGFPVAVFFWRRESQRRLAHRISPNDVMGYGIPGMITVSEPALGHGETCVLLDGSGSLIEMHARPALTLPPLAGFTWKALLRAAGFDEAALEPVTTCRDPGTVTDKHVAWTGPHPDAPGTEIHVEAAVRGGRPVYFWVGEASRKGESDRAMIGESPGDVGTTLSEYAYGGLRLMALTVGAWMAWVNVRRGVANLTGAGRLVAVYAAAYMAMWLFMAHHTPDLADQWAILAAAVGYTLMNGLTLWVIYLALEPSVRAAYPEWMIGWNRLLAGRWADPRVGADVLIGAAMGVAWAILMPLRRTLGPEALGAPFVPHPVWMPTLSMGPAGPMACYVWVPLFFQLLEFFLLVIVLLVARLLAPRRPALGLWVTVTVWTVFWTVRWSLWLGAAVSPFTVAMAAAASVLPVVAFLRAGLLAYVAFGLFAFMLTDLPVTLDGGAFYVWTGRCVLAVLVALAVFACYRAWEPARGNIGG